MELVKCTPSKSFFTILIEKDTDNIVNYENVTGIKRLLKKQLVLHLNVLLLFYNILILLIPT